MAKFFCSTGNTWEAKRSARMRSSWKGTDCCANHERAKVCGRRTLLYRIFLVLAIAAAVWGGVYYVMSVRSGEHLQSGVEMACREQECLKFHAAGDGGCGFLYRVSEGMEYSEGNASCG